jgi:hypothetical protein
MTMWKHQPLRFGDRDQRAAQAFIDQVARMRPMINSK